MARQLKCFCFLRMNDLSPAALAVWEAFNKEEPGAFDDYGDCLAAALRAAVENCGHDDSEGYWLYIPHLLAIAAELETPTK